MDKTNVEIWDIIHEKIRLPSHWYQNLLFECTNLYSLNQSFHHYRFRSPLKHICTWNSRKMYFYLLSFSGRSQQWQQTRCEVAKRAGLLGIKRFFFFFSAEINHKVQISMARTDLFSPCMLHGSSYYSWQNKLYLIYHLLPDLWLYISLTNL